MRLYLIVDTYDCDAEDDDPAWLKIAEWRPEMPFVVESVPRIAAKFFRWHCRPLTEDDLAAECALTVWDMAKYDDTEFDRRRVYALEQALAGGHVPEHV